MAETGATRSDAQTMARQMLGSEHQTIRLPESERDIVRLAVATAGKWRTLAHWSGRVKLLGFDMGEIDVTARWMGLTPDERLLQGIGVIERAALKVLDRS